MEQAGDLFKNLFQNVNDAVLIGDEKRQTVYINPFAEKLIGYTSVDLKDVSWKQLLPDNAKQIGPEDFGTCLCPMALKNGSTMNADLQWKTIHVSGKQYVQLIIHKTTDNTFTELDEEFKHLFKTIFEYIPDQIYIKDQQHQIVICNKATSINFGDDDPDQTIGKCDHDLFDKKDADIFQNVEKKVLNDGQKMVNIEEEYITVQGKPCVMLSTKVPLHNIQGEIIALIGINHDITIRKKMEDELRKARGIAESANKAKSSFLAMMSHEIRTPMNGVIGAASLLVGTNLNEQQEEFVHTIEISGENLLSIINDILDYSKIEAGKIELEKSPFVLRDCIEDAFDLFVEPAAKKNIELLYSIEPDVPDAFLGDSTRTRQIVVNLIGNAVKFTQKGEISLTINLLPSTEDKSQRRLQFAIRDTGIGISKEAQGRLFTAFTQADTSSTRKYGGTGLGLSISRRLVDLMGGEIWIESKEGEGSTFFFTMNLPVAENVKKRSSLLPLGALRNKRILIVDDNEINCQLLSGQVARWSMLSETFTSPREALKHLTRNSVSNYDLAVIDYQMPEMDGVELAEKIHSNETTQSLPIIVLSSSYEHIPPTPAIAAQLSKPVKQAKLCEQLLRAIGDGIPSSGNPKSSDDPTQQHQKKELRILVAEDNKINQRIVEMMLKRLRYDHSGIVADGEAAVTAVREGDYDVVLMDVQMPNVNGLDATRQIRELTGSSDRPYIIAMTAGVMKEEQDSVKEAGMNGFLAKPLSVKQLESTLLEVSLRIGKN